MLSDEYKKTLQRSTPCTTDDSGKVKNQTCVFPFKFKRNIYRSCTTEGANGGPSWCATSVNKRGRYIKGSWGNCNQASCKQLVVDNTGIMIGCEI